MIGKDLGPYHVVEKLGEGGMGVVYRAHDGRLGRDVALKVLPEAFTDDRDRAARFEREARALAALNHPNIAHIHGVEESGTVVAIAMELVDGPTLDQKIGAGLAVVDALPIARQIALALEAAHEAGIVHRDLKPSNIKVKDDGTVKVLDFGLAKSADAAGRTADASTMTSPAMTQHGMILGTAAYMSPEQARGKPVDARADIWSFGAVLYEMLTGTRAFPGQDVMETLSGVMRAEADWAALPRSTPRRLRELIERCLTKDPRQRLQAIGEARIAIDRAITEPAEIAPVAAVSARPSVAARWLPWIVAAALGGVALWVWIGRSTPRVEAGNDFQLTAAIGDSVLLAPQNGPAVLFSPDGALIAFRGALKAGDVPRIFVRRLDQLTAQPLAGTEQVTDFFFSPDGKWLAFFNTNKLNKVPVTGGSVFAICDVGNARGGDWLPDGRIVFPRSSRSPLTFVSAEGGTPEPFTKFEADEITHRYPQVLPGNRGILYTSHTNSVDYNAASLYVQPLDGGPRVLVLKGAYLGRYVASGHVLYVRDDKLFAVRFDLDHLKVSGTPVPVNENLATNIGSGGAQYAVSSRGTLFYLPATAAPLRTLSWITPRGEIVPVAAPAVYRAARLSPEGHRIALEIAENRRSDIWVYDVDRENMTRVTSHPPTSAEDPMWMPDGQGLVFSSDHETAGVPHLYWKRADGTGSEQRLTSAKHTEREIAGSWNPFAKTLAFRALNETTKTGNDIWLLPLDGDATTWRAGAATAAINDGQGDSDAAFSPDGKWIAYVSNASTRDEIYVRPYPALDRKEILSNAGGTQPVWDRTSRQLYYLDAASHIMSVTVVGADGALHPGKPTPWSSAPVPNLSAGQAFDMQRDGSRALIIQSPERAVLLHANVVLVFNFFEQLKKVGQ